MWVFASLNPAEQTAVVLRQGWGEKEQPFLFPDFQADFKSGGSKRFLPSLLLPGEENLSAGGKEGSVSSTLTY